MASTSDHAFGPGRGFALTSREARPWLLRDPYYGAALVRGLGGQGDRTQPWSAFDTLCDTIGTAAAFRLVKVLGGLPVTVPSREGGNEASPLRRLLGNDVMSRLSARMVGETILLPRVHDLDATTYASFINDYAAALHDLPRIEPAEQSALRRLHEQCIEIAEKPEAEPVETVTRAPDIDPRGLSEYELRRALWSVIGPTTTPADPPADWVDRSKAASLICGALFSRSENRLSAEEVDTFFRGLDIGSPTSILSALDRLMVARRSGHDLARPSSAGATP